MRCVKVGRKKHKFLIVARSLPGCHERKKIHKIPCGFKKNYPKKVPMYMCSLVCPYSSSCGFHNVVVEILHFEPILVAEIKITAKIKPQIKQPPIETFI